MDYQKFKLAYESSGLTQSAYGKQIGKSGSMVSYYLKKASQQITSDDTFSKLEVTESMESYKVLRIKTASGVELEILL